jgi:hypothetical protein
VGRESLREIDRNSEVVEPTRTDSVEEAVRVLEHAESAGVVLRLLGGVAFYIRCPSARRDDLARSYGDIDFVGHARQSAGIKSLFAELGYLPLERFNVLQGGRRLVFVDPAHKRRADVFLDVFEMCHKFDLRQRMEIDRQTIPLADLLATKLQVVQTNEKDIGDAICLLVDHEIGDTDLRDTVNGEYLGKLCGEDWGIYKTFSVNLALLSVASEQWSLKESERELVNRRIDYLTAAIEKAPKSVAWKMRAAIGERIRWYELPEEDAGLVEQVKAEES